jgi:hypothetical protein
MPAQPSETSGYLTSGEARLYATLHRPAERARAVAVLAAPFGEERKCAYRLLVELARRLAASGVLALRCDYRGTGESTGEPAAVTLADWLADLGQAAALVAAEAPGVPRLLVGARLGANLVLELPPLPGDRLVLWEPLTSGAEFLAEQLRRKQVKAMMSGGDAAAAVAACESQWATGEAVDLDGYPVAAALARGLRARELLPQLGVCKEQPLLLVHVTGAKRLTGRWAEAQAWCQAAPQRQFALRAEKPFWGRLDYYEAEDLLRETMAFVG